MYRGELLFFLLVVGIFSIDFFRPRATHFLDFTTLPPKITQWKLDSCTRTISVQQVIGGIPPYDFYVFKQDSLDSSNWQVYRLIKEQLPQISGLPPGAYRLKAVNEGISSPSFSTNILEINFPADPEIEFTFDSSICSGESPAIVGQLLNSEVPLPFWWTARVLLAPEQGEVLGYTTNPTVPQFELSDTLINTGRTAAKISYQLQALVDGCPSPARTEIVQVDPQARIEARISESIVCSDTPFSISLLPQSWGASPMQVQWSAELLLGQVTGLDQGGPFQVTALSPISQILANRGTVPARVRYTFFPAFQGCEGIPEVVEVVVLPKPQVSPQKDLTACPGEWISVPKFNSILTEDSITYSWVVSDPSIGVSSGTGDRIPEFEAINTGMSSKRALVTVTSKLNFQGISCTGTSQTFSITVNAPMVVEEELSNYGGFGVSCTGASDGKIKLHTSGGNLPDEDLRYTYSWTGPEGFVSTTKDLQGLQAGEYRVRITSSTGNCTLEKSLILNQPEALWIQSVSPAETVVALSCAGDASGKIQVEVGGGSGEKKLFWTAKDGGILPAGMENASLLEGLKRGTYLLSVTDGNGCSIEQNFSITEPEPLLITQTKVDNFCFGGSSGQLSVIPTGGMGPYRYAWSGPNGFSSTVASPQNLVSGVYQVTISDANGCGLLGPPLTINEPSAISVTQSKVDNVCFQGTTGSISITTSGGIAPYSYAWTGPNGFSTTNKDLSALVSGIYQVRITDANGCGLLGPPLTITEPSAIALTQSKEDNLCSQGATGSISITSSGGIAPYSYVWTGPNGFSSTNEDLSALVSGTYQVTVRDANGCSPLVGAQITIAEPAVLSLTQSKVDNLCSQGATGSISITVLGGTAPCSFAWTGPNGFTATTEDLQNLVSGNYQVTVMDANGCTVFGVSQTITQPASLTLAAQVQPETCADRGDGSIELILSGGIPPYQVRWDHGVNGPVATSLGLGTYRVTVTDQGGCTHTAEYSLLPISALRLEGTVTYQSTANQIFAFLQSSPQGGTPPYTFRWNTGQSSPTLTVTESGIYTLQLKDAKGCVQEKEFVVNLPLPLAIALTMTTVPLCDEQGQETKIQLSISNGLAPYQISWSMGSVTATGMQFTTRGSGLVKVEVRDALGLIQKQEITILPHLRGLLDFDSFFESQEKYQADIVGFKGVFRPLATWPYQVISWNFGDGTSSSEANPNHAYTRKGRYEVTLTVLDNSGCLITQSKTLDILDYFIEIPNVFTPNGDQLNDTYFPKFRFITDLELQVMNKWGELIYRSRSVDDAGWDGTVSGQKAPEGVYVYKLSYQVPDGRILSSSSTLLLAR
jgi:gliding motility-associated-like protein